MNIAELMLTWNLKYNTTQTEVSFQRRACKEGGSDSFVLPDVKYCHSPTHLEQGINFHTVKI